MYSKYHEPTFHQPGLNPHILNRLVNMLYRLRLLLLDILKQRDNKKTLVKDVLLVSSKERRLSKLY
jgi:hypothetical protein